MLRTTDSLLHLRASTTPRSRLLVLNSEEQNLRSETIVHLPPSRTKNARPRACPTPSKSNFSRAVSGQDRRRPSRAHFPNTDAVAPALPPRSTRAPRFPVSQPATPQTPSDDGLIAKPLNKAPYGRNSTASISPMPFRREPIQLPCRDIGPARRAGRASIPHACSSSATS